MLLFSIGGCALLLIVFLFYRSETLRRNYKALRMKYTSTDKNNKYLAQQMMMLAEEIQYSYLVQLDGAEKRGIIDSAKAKKVKALVHCIGSVIEGVLKSYTVQQCLTGALPEHGFSLEEIQKMISEEESHIRMAWTKNSLDGYMKLCRELMAKAQGQAAKAQV